jgi:hypothetical protein
MKTRFILIFVAIFIYTTSCKNTEQFSLTDLHIHLKGGFTLEDAVKKSKAENIKYGIAFNCGLKFPIHSDRQIDSVINIMKDYPQFYIAMQAEGREWVNMFSKESRDKFDYVFTDAMTFTDEKGRRNRIWIKDETWIDTIVKIMSEEPINIYVNPTYLPTQMADRYDSFWTEDRMDRVINAAKANNIAIEINNRYKIPSLKFIQRAHKAGVLFTVGTNNTDYNFSGAEYAREMIRECRLTQNDFYQPLNKRANGQL